MNQEWSEQNKQMQSLIRNEKKFQEGIGVLLRLREDLFHQIEIIVNTYPADAFDQMPFPNAKGYHSKTLAYSM